MLQYLKDIVIGDYKQPAKPREEDTEETALKAKRELRAWKDGDTIALRRTYTRKDRQQVNCKGCI